MVPHNRIAKQRRAGTVVRWNCMLLVPGGVRACVREFCIAQVVCVVISAVKSGTQGTREKGLKTSELECERVFVMLLLLCHTETCVK